MSENTYVEGGLKAPERHPLLWREEEFFDEAALNAELQRVFDICHGCRRCVNLCDAFPTLFDLIDESENFDVESVDPKDYSKVSEQCYLCDLCFSTKCPYVPPHPWALDFPHLMLRAKAFFFRRGQAKIRDRIISSTDAVARVASAPPLRGIFNFFVRVPFLRALAEKIFSIHRHARIPPYRGNAWRRRFASVFGGKGKAEAAGRTSGKVAIFATCYGNWQRSEMIADLASVLTHNNIEVKIIEGEHCCGMPKLEIGDLEAVERAMKHNIPRLAEAAEAGWDIVAPVPSCVLMFKQEFPLMYPDDGAVQKVAGRMFDPFEYLHLRHKENLLNLDFKKEVGKVFYQVACHQRVQNIGNKTREILGMIPGVEIEVAERCSGHDGVYAVRLETREKSQKILRPLLRQAEKTGAQTYTSDCPLAGGYIAEGMGQKEPAPHPLTLLREAYNLEPKGL